LLGGRLALDFANIPPIQRPAHHLSWKIDRFPGGFAHRSNERGSTLLRFPVEPDAAQTLLARSTDLRVHSAKFLAPWSEKKRLPPIGLAYQPNPSHH